MATTSEIGRLDEERSKLAHEHISALTVIDAMVVEANAENRKLTDAEVAGVKLILDGINKRREVLIQKMMALVQK